MTQKIDPFVDRNLQPVKSFGFAQDDGASIQGNEKHKTAGFCKK